MPTPLGYLTENAQIRYPFKDDASLLAVNRTTPLANNVLLDFQLATTDATLQRVALTRIETNTSGLEHAIDFTFTLFVYDQTLHVWTRLTAAFSKLQSEVVPYEFFAVDWDNYKGKIVLGQGALDLLARPPQALTFPADAETGMAAELQPSVILPVMPSVSRVHFRNVNEESDLLFVDFAVDDVEALNLRGGTNTTFKNTGAGIGMNVLKGTGDGLYNPCNDLPTDVIKSINGIEGENFVFTSGDCYKTVYHLIDVAGGDPQRDPGAPGLEFQHVCRPRCTQQEVNGFAFYANRVQDAVNKIGDYIGQIVTSLEAGIAEREAAQVPPIATPYIELQTSGSEFNGRHYESIGVGIYDPNKKKMTATLTGVFSNGLSDTTYFNANPSWPGWVYYPGTATLQEANNVYPLPLTIDHSNPVTTFFTLRGLDCRGTVLANVVAHAPSPVVDQTLSLYLTTYENSVATATAFKQVQLQPTPGPYMNVRSRRGVRTDGTYVYFVTVELFDSNPAWSGLTNFSASVSSAHILSAAQLRINNGTAEDVPYTTESILFVNKAIAYPNRAVVTFQLDSAVSTSVQLSLQQSVGAVIRTTTLSFT